uniref:Uncharacterized protein n=1 Tax=Cynoglossus semilaevis TaxID=244447 RepID=A0A3P8W8K4_CYNSE
MASLYLALASLVLLALGFCEEEKVFMQRAGVAFNNREHRSLLFVNNGERFGNWTWPEMCPENFFAVGFSIRVKTLLTLIILLY